MLSDSKVVLCGSSALCAIAIGAALAVAPSALAQNAAQPAASAGNGMEEIVVTARRKEERVQSVPLAITAFSQVDLDKDHIGQLRDLYKDVPSLAVSYSSSDPNSFYSGQVRLRGLGGVEVYFADIPITSADYSTTTGLTHGLSPGLYFDLDSVEVDKGAQGTLFGRPSIGGLIAIQPKHPTDDFDGYIKTTFGNYSDKENEFTVNVPIVSDKLMVRVGGQMQQRDGYTKDEQTGQELDNRNYYAWRVGVTFRPTDDLENYFLYDGYWQDSDGASDVLTVVNPNLKLSTINLGAFSVPLTIGNGLPIAALENPATQIATYVALAKELQAGGKPSLAIFPGLEQVLQAQQALGARAILGRYSSGIGKDYFYGFTDVATWDINDTLTLKNIAGARVFKQLGVDDFTNTGLPILTIGWPGNNHGWTDDSVQYTEEVQLFGKALADKLDWRVGGFLLFDHPLGYNTEVSDAVGSPTYDHFHEEQRSQAIFAHGIYDLSDYVDNLKLTAGYRYTWDYDSLGEVSTKDLNYPAYINSSGVPTPPSKGGVRNCQNNVVFTPQQCFAQVDSNFNSPGWNVGLDEQLTSNILVYVRSGNAYRPGGTNLAVPAPFNRYNPEHATDVELGTKVDWTPMEDIHARTNFAMFHTGYKAIQVSQVVAIPSPIPGGTPTAQSITANAAAANLYGMELEQTVNLPFGLDVKAQGSYFYSKYSNYPQVFGQTGAPGFQYIPQFQFGVTPTYHLPIDESLGQVDASLAWSWYGHQSTSPLLNEALREQPHFENIDINVDWDNILGHPIDATFFMTNVTNNLHIVGEIPLMTSLGFSSVAYNPPRMFGGSLKYRFSAATFGGEAEAAPYTPPPVVAPAPAPAPVAHSYMVFFDFNKSDLTSDAVSIVDQAAKNAGPAKATELTVTGHTDTVGSDAYNMRLSKRRAESVAAQLEKDGIPSSEIELVAKGKHDLLVPTKDGVREPQNRRVTIVYGGATS